MNSYMLDAIAVVGWLIAGVLSWIVGEHVVGTLLLMAAGIWRIGAVLAARQ